MVSGGGGEVEPVEPGVGVPGVVVGSGAEGGEEGEEGEEGGDHVESWTLAWCHSLTGGGGWSAGQLITSLSHSQILSSHRVTLTTSYFSRLSQTSRNV